MLLAIDIGNSNIVMSTWDNVKWEQLYRIASKDTQGTPLDEAAYHGPIASYLFDKTNIDKIVIASVVPDLTEIVQQVCREHSTAHIIRVTLDMKSPLSNTVPPELGQDLFANAVASYSKSNLMMKRSVISANKAFPTASITVDLGTALTFTAVDSQGKIAGVSISTGIESSFKALVGSTSQISTQSLHIPEKALGTNTQESLNSGIMLGYRHLIKGMVGQIKEELNERSKVYATGGLSALMHTLAPPHDTVFDEINPYHTLDGLKILAQYNSDPI